MEPLEPKSEEKCSSMSFSSLCSLLEKIEKTSGHQKKLKLLFSPGMKKYVDGQSIFPLLRLILPGHDTVRGKYNLKQTSYANTYIKALHLNQNVSTDAQRLKFWNDPSKLQALQANAVVSNDFGTILEDVLKPRISSNASTASLGDVNNILDALANATGAEAKTAVISERILNHFSPREQKWISKIIFQDLKIGLQVEPILKGFYPGALDRFNQCSSLQIVCEEEGRPPVARTESSSFHTGVELFSTFNPMKAKGFPRSSISQVTAVEAAMQGNPFVMDIKLDGERICCHINGDDNAPLASSSSFEGAQRGILMTTRNLTDYSSAYLPLSLIVKNHITGNSGTLGKGWCVILDGEVCAIDTATGIYKEFGANATVRKMERDCIEEFIATSIAAGKGTSATLNLDSSDSVPHWHGWDKKLNSRCKYIVFDLLYLTGPGDQAEEMILEAMRECGLFSGSCSSGRSAAMKIPSSGDITMLPQAVRRNILKRVLHTELPDILELIKCRSVSATATSERRELIEDFFNEVTLAGEEGLVVKNLLSEYRLADRSDAWVKVKPEYGDQTFDLDLIVLACYYGEGSSIRGQGYSRFLCGVKDESIPGRFHTVCRVGTGYSVDELKAIRQLVKEVEIPWNPKRSASWQPPTHLAHIEFQRPEDVPAVYIPPEKSFILEVRCAELVPTANYSIGFTCRFPRVHHLRTDRSWDSCMTSADIHKIRVTPRMLANEVSLRDGTYHSQSSSSGVGAGAGAGAMSSQFDAIGCGGSGSRSTVAVSRKRKVANSSGSSSSQTSRANAITANAVDSIFLNKRSVIKGRNDQYDSIEGNSTKLFTGHSFSVPPSNAYEYTDEHGERVNYSREEIIGLLEVEGGSVVGSATDTDCIIVAGSKLSFQIQAYIDGGKNDVVDFSYYVDCVKQNALLPIHRLQYLGLSQATKSRFEGTVDVFGDSFTEETGVKEYTKVFQNVDRVIKHLSKEFQNGSNKGPAYPTGATAGLASSAAAAATSALVKRRKRDSTITAATAAAAAAAAAASAAHDIAEKLSVYNDWERLSKMNWRQIVGEELLDEERFPVVAVDGEDHHGYDGSRYSNSSSTTFNSMWCNGMVFYLDCDEEEEELLGCGGGGLTSTTSSEFSCPSTLGVSLELMRRKTRHTELLALGDRLRLYGAEVSPNLSREVTYIVLGNYSSSSSSNNIISSDTSKAKRVEALQSRIRLLRSGDSFSATKTFVSVQDVMECFKQKSPKLLLEIVGKRKQCQEDDSIF